MINKLFLFIIILFIWFNFTYAVDIKENNLNCTPEKYDISWLLDVKMWLAVSYSLKSNFVSLEEIDNKINIKIFNDKKEFLNSERQKINYTFPEVWKYRISLNIKEKNWCEYFINKDINVYSKIVIYISDEDEISFEDQAKLNNVLLKKIDIKSKNITSTQEQFISNSINSIYLLQDSDIIIINTNDYSQILQWLDKISKIYSINFPNKKLFIPEDNLFLSKSILSWYIKTLQVNIYTIPELNLLNLLNYISKWLNVSDILKDKDFSITQVLFEKNDSELFFLTSIINKLILNWFPISTLALIFSIWVTITVLNFIRQFIWLSIFSLYYPLFLWICFYLFDYKFNLIFILASLISTIILTFVYKKINFLINTKIALYLNFYIILSLIFIYFSNVFWLINFWDIKFDFIFFPFILIPVVIFKIFPEERKIFTIWFFTHFLEFSFIVFICYFIIWVAFIQNLFLSYSELVILLFLSNFIIWKFTWLQLVEYIRFMPVVKKHFQEE